MDKEWAAACDGHQHTSEAAHFMLSAFYTLYITFLHMHTQQFPLHGSSYMSWRWWHSQEHFLYLKAALSVFYTCYSNCWLMLYLLVKGKQQLPGYSLLSYSNHNKIFFALTNSHNCSFLSLRRKKISTRFPPCKHFCEGAQVQGRGAIMSILKADISDSVCLSDSIFSYAVFAVFL